MASLNLSHPRTRVPAPGRWPLGLGLALIAAFGTALLTATDLGGQAVLWENVSWTLFCGTGLALAIFGVTTATGPERRVREAIALASACWLAGQVVWLIQGTRGFSLVPYPPTS